MASVDDFVANEIAGPAVVIDNGSSMMKAGFTGDDAPRAVFPALTGRTRGPCFVGRMAHPFCCVGEEAQAKRGILSVRYPIDKGVCHSWDDMERIWSFIFNNELRVPSEEQSVILTEKLTNPKANREKATQIMFETFNVLALYLAIDAELALQTTGKVNGLVVDSGDGGTVTVPIWEGHALREHVCTSSVSGRDISASAVRLIEEKGCSLTSNYQSDRPFVVDMKEKLGYVAVDFEAELKRTKEEVEVDYEFPDGQSAKFGAERFRWTESLFNPKLMRMETEEDGLSNMIYKSIMQSDADLREDLLGNIVLNGGNMMFKGIEQRIYRDLTRLVGPMVPFAGIVKGYFRQKHDVNMSDDVAGLTHRYCGIEEVYGGGNEIKIVDNKDIRKYAAWVGGSIWGSLSSNLELFISKDEYDDYGPGIVHRKCF